METCKHGSSIRRDLLLSLHSNQGGTGRHRCPNCAYQLGFNLGSSQKYEHYSEFIDNVDGEIEICSEGTKTPTDYLLITGDSQGGLGRHRCCNCAFKEGFEDGLSFIHAYKGSLLKTDNVKLTKVEKPTNYKIQKDNSKTSTVKNFDFEGNNNKLKLVGDIGENIVLEYEKNRPYNNDNASRIRNVAKEIGDGAGYDILTFDEKNNEKYVEVKTTTNDIKTPFYISLNEKNFLFNNENTFIYRVFNLSIEKNTAEFFILSKKNILELNYLPQTFKVIFE